MSGAAAFFDLDRTLLPGASGPVISAALREAGVLSGSPVPGESLLFGVFDLIGETRPSMMLARQGVRFSKGWNAADVARAGEIAAQRLVDQIQPYAREEIARHRNDGRRLVIATTSPADVVEPLARALGFDDAICTHYGRREGIFTGTVDGHYVWGDGKLAAIREWAEVNDVALDQSWAYSDSYYDQPMLAAVGNPVAVNPDPRLGLVAVARRWPVRYLDVPEGVPKVVGVEPQQALTAFLRPQTIPYARFDFAGVENIPATGPAILAPNHRSYFDFVAIGMALGQSGRRIRFLAKQEVFAAPVIGEMMRALGGISVARGSGAVSAMREAVGALESGEVVAILPQGTIPRGEAFFEPVLKGRTGVARLAKLSGAPVIPVGVWGSEQVWPRSARVPNLWNILHPPRVSVTVGSPMELDLSLAAEEVVVDVMAAVQALLPDEAQTRRLVTAKELARTFPPGHEAE